jgi:hypothetical protein
MFNLLKKRHGLVDGNRGPIESPDTIDKPSALIQPPPFFCGEKRPQQSQRRHAPQTYHERSC